MNDFVPSEFYLSHNHPSPFSEKGAQRFCVAHKTRVNLQVLDSEHQTVETLLHEEEKTGTYEVEFAANRGGAANVTIY